jgi:hypothetical protein
MAMRTEIDIEITPEGEVVLKVRGAGGDKCLELTKALEQELGIVVDREMTSEYYQQSVDTDRVVKVGGEE